MCDYMTGMDGQRGLRRHWQLLSSFFRKPMGWPPYSWTPRRGRLWAAWCQPPKRGY